MYTVRSRYERAQIQIERYDDAVLEVNETNTERSTLVRRSFHHRDGLLCSVICPPAYINE